MEIISNTIDFQLHKPSAVVIGKFDGIHLGHRELLMRLARQKEKGLQTVVFTFDKSPSSLFVQDGDSYRELCTLEEKREIFRAMDVDIMIEFPMNQETAAIPAEEFITEILQNNLCCQMLIAGEDVSFGYKGRGDSRMLLAYSKICGYDLEIVDKLLVNRVFTESDSEEEISSSMIRKSIGNGEVAKAYRLMGRAFSVKGTVVHGRKLAGQVLDMPTANLAWPENKVLPAFGVYITEVHTGEGCYKGITNVGQKPTVQEDGEKQILAETYLYEYQGDLYEKEITLHFLDFVRPERRFDGLEALKAQMQLDMAYGREK